MNTLRQIVTIIALYFVSLLVRVRVVSTERKCELQSIGRFRSANVQWVETNGTELDEFDVSSDTVHVWITWRWSPTVLAYGRLIFGAHQIIEHYQDVLNGAVVPRSSSVEISRLIVVPRYAFLKIRGTLISRLLQMLIYRTFFRITNERGNVHLWWAVMGERLFNNLRRNHFPFSRVNNLTGEDGAGRYFLAKMEIRLAESEFKIELPWLYRWFLPTPEKSRRQLNSSGAS